MKKFSFLQKKNKLVSSILWSKQVNGKQLCYTGEDIETFFREFDQLEDEIIRLWDLSKLSWDDYQLAIAEVQDAKQLFAQFVYH